MANLSVDAEFQPDSTMQPLPEHVREALASGWVDPSKGLLIDKANDLLKPGYLPLETGYTRLPDGKVQVSCLTKMPGCKGRMINWWFGWMANSNHYKWWHPKDHAWTAWEKGDQSRNNDPDDANYIGDSHLVEETMGGETSRLRINFRDPSEYLNTSQFAEANVGAAVCARVGYLNKPLKIAHMIHLIRDTDDGCEMRSRFWAGDIEITIPVLGIILGKLLNNKTMRKKVMPAYLGEGLLLHCAEEMNHLASFLPDLFQKMTNQKAEG